MDALQIARFWSSVSVKGTSRCWLWNGSKGSTGYGRFAINYKTPMAHRIAYELLRGEIPEGLVLDHLCRTPLCVNPFHLEPVTSAENTYRGESLPARNRKKTHCKRGHELSVANTIIKPSTGHRNCRECMRQANRASKAKSKALAAWRAGKDKSEKHERDAE